MHRRRIWSEHVPLETLREPRVLDLLARFELELCVAVRPDAGAGLAPLLAACEPRRVPVVLWPMLADGDGRWAHPGNAGRYADYIRRIVDELDVAGIRPREVAFDLEPPIGDVRGLLGDGSVGSRIGAARGVWAGLGDTTAAFAAVRAELADRGIATSAAVVPLALAGGPPRGGRPGQQDGPARPGRSWGRVSVMLYSSIIEGWSRGWLTRADAVAVLARGCRAVRDRFGERAGVSLGTVGVGAFGDEPVYRSVQELVEDVSVARSAGVDDLSLFDLGGVLQRAPAEPWLAAFCETPAAAAPPAASARARVALFLMSLGGGLRIASPRG